VIAIHIAVYWVQQCREGYDVSKEPAAFLSSLRTSDLNDHHIII